ncbi:ABC-type sugar transport system ATPase subunit [Bradyrhizobium sp. LM3.2]
MTSIKISFDHVCKEFVTRGEGRDPTARFTALEDITLDVRSGEFLVLVGPSGCGEIDVARSAGRIDDADPRPHPP